MCFRQLVFFLLISLISSLINIDQVNALTNIGKWSVSTKDNTNVCLVVQFAATFYITINATVNYQLDIRPNSTVDTHVDGCGDVEKLSLILDQSVDNRIEIQIGKDGNDFYVDKIFVGYFVDPQKYPLHPKKGQREVSTWSGRLFESKLTDSYVCTSLTLVDNFDIKTNVLEIGHFKLEPFRKSTSVDFERPEDLCSADTASRPWKPDIIVLGGIVVTFFVCSFLIVYICRHTCCEDCCEDIQSRYTSIVH